MVNQKFSARLRAWREERRLNRQIDMIGNTIPVVRAPLRAVRPGGSVSLLRVPVGLALTAGGVFSFLPFLGVWMLPLGLMLLAVDIKPLRRPVSAFTIRGKRFVQKKWRRASAALR